ncbi:GNAT family N-acetyltransferase [Clostridium celatum]|uniref:Acetyltransferase, GNAT family n=1 Tax=Clostridium celatum DSM 1785 TaxID=545697 RepID=L1QP53_9CLOT|nr:GNAT family N-acetyltransferase [Clostridium celatum]EKY29778.1 acetyltransferase, GNAT family [Clostridium celatum DSM 1785]MCE9654818.1 GNAT family N-acetyltransferase [Clostridium celatum]MDU2265084.1 GNAT family N-acetyltransferase [Clostridium celatum]MDU3723301.1 GNAT family N-acetyltransferase [Clostridium celatum]MDU6294576.1 GNAT family N-acetyltransferase [Clostridium celatum]
MKFEIVKFNELSVDDMYEIAKSRFEVFVCEQGITEEQDFDDKDKECYHIMLKENGRIVAYSRIVPKGLAYEYTSIGRVLVLESHRRKGIAQKMMKFALDFIKNNLDENIVVLSAQEYVKDMYSSVGFKVISEIYNEVNIPHVKMKIEL